MIRYSASFTQLNNASIEMVELNDEKFIYAKGEDKDKLGFHNKETRYPDPKGVLYPLSHENRLVLNKLLPYTAPMAFGSSVATFGTGDRLGLATFGHIQALANSKAKPILAQQSKRELSLTGRSYRDVLDDVSYNVFQVGYTGGYGADGDHLKTKEDIKGALNDGYTMITLDCSDYIGTEDVSSYLSMSPNYRHDLESRYLGKTFNIGDKEFAFDKEDLEACAAIYKAAIDFAVEVYEELILTAAKPVDFELSVDETESITTNLHHFFVATELRERNIKISSLAPRFVGEFQKGIDYIGDIEEFKKQVELHAHIAKHFGYKLSIHSGSDKFSVFPYIGMAAGTNLHIKTSGTSWLEALKVIAKTNPTLFRTIYELAKIHFEDAKTYYQVSTRLSDTDDIGNLRDDQLQTLLDHPAYRQILHITYGYILNDSLLGPEFFTVLKANQTIYDAGLKKHIEKHLHFLDLGGSQ